MADTLAAPLAPPLPGDTARRVDWYGLPGAARSLAVADAIRNHDGLTMVVTSSSHAALQLEAELAFFLDEKIPRQVMPDWETLPYDVFSPHQDIVSERLRTLRRLPGMTSGTLIVPADTLMQRLGPVAYLEATSLVIGTGERLELTDMSRRLERAGYRRVSEVMEHGEFAVRGAILDLYPMGSEDPYRIDLFDDEVETIRRFDPETQRSTERLSRVELLPAREFPVDEDGITRFRRSFRTVFEGDPTATTVYRDVSEGRLPNGIEYYLPLFFDATATLFDYLPDATMAIRLDDVDAQLDAVWSQINERYEQRRHDRERPLLAPRQLFLPPDTVREQLNGLPQIRLHEDPAPAVVDDHPTRLIGRTLPDLRATPSSARPLQRLQQFLAGFDGRTLLLAETAGRRQDLLERLQAAGLSATVIDGWRAFRDGEQRLAITVAPLETGAILKPGNLALIPESSLFAERVSQHRRRRAPERDPDAIVRDLTDLRTGAAVVHEDHGVGRYRGLRTLTVGDLTTEFLTIEYAGGDKLYVPVSSLHLVSRYTGMDPEQAPMHRLGGEQWERVKRRAAERARDAAAELLDIYARRAASRGHGYRFPRSDYERFIDQFPFEETPDQEQAIHAMVRDLESPQPMDRVICGDVGFGKTEVAMRAAFIGVQDGVQVAVLVPTTLLAQQHYQNFSDRFAEWPVRIELLSRFRSPQEQTAVLRDLHAGKVDVVIGTHKLLQPSVRFHNLGLLIIDEEHRFGVRQKEQLKALRSELDVLTLTATPIPRTLNISLAGLRDLSIIATAPARRLAVKTFINEWNDPLIREACLRELHRGGQVYFLHNDVASIDRIARHVEALVPEARVRVAHGQMRERELERVMLDFYRQRFQILVCTTIVESGIDVPSANTIIINRADRLGLAQLHQLRGRVGRSHHRAYAYLIAPPRRVMTADAAKRLEAIASLEELGVGFTLASHDLEIRGAGELLGEGQSGQIQEVGFSLYSELLERAVSDLKAGREPALERPLHQGAEVDLRLTALLPEAYLPDIHTRLVLYKRIAGARDEEALRELQVEMIDRFGLLPPAAKNLFRLTTIKLQAQRLGIRKLDAGPDGGVLVFGEEPRVDPGIVVRLVQEQPDVYRLEGQQRLRFRMPMQEPGTRIETITRLMDTLDSGTESA